MSDVKVGKVAAEATSGTLLWHTAEEEETDYVEATVAPTSTEDNNVTAPSLNGVTATELPLIAEAPAYAAGPFSSTGRIEPIIEIALGVDATNTEAGESVSTPTIRWSWTES